MPIYEYQCSKCGTFEAMQRITESPLKKCPTCKGKVERVMSRTSFVLKGSGWYLTDYARAGKTEGKDGGKSDSSSTAAANGASSSESKSEARSDAGKAAESSKSSDSGKSTDSSKSAASETSKSSGSTKAAAK
ncbi:MAG: zinc ribbon domain-containing protein [Candidatus Binataceae bacterium]|nr:zinc ribbon domain-containing protein [Candidatus Binataceae bacterium]